MRKHMRKLSEDFMNDLKSTDGLLHPILERVRQDDTLMLAIRKYKKEYINVYYRGGNLLMIEKQSDGSYDTYFDDKFKKQISPLPNPIKSQDDARTWVDAFPQIKEIMDIHFSKNPKPEREFQQLVARENNYSTISNETEYFITDIELAGSEPHARFDMLAIRWLASDRKDVCNCRGALIEMKYGDGALCGSAGLIKHLQDIDALISDNNKYESLLKTIESQFNQLDELGLLSFNRSCNRTKVKLVTKDKPEVIFVLSNHNPRSKKLSSEIDKIIAYVQTLKKTQCFDLKFFVPNFAGYGLHSDCMLTLDQFRNILEARMPKKRLH